jgi:hypothetical protein
MSKRKPECDGCNALRSLCDKLCDQRNKAEADYAAVKAERDILVQTFAETCAELGCAQDNDAALMAIHALRTQRDELARAVERRGYIGNATIGGWCDHCLVDIGSSHAPGCPVALAEKITKEAGDGH